MLRTSSYTEGTFVSRLIAYFGNDPDRVECALFPARLALYARTPEPGSGWGLGFVQGGDVLLQKRPRGESSEVDFFSLAKDLRADALVGRVGLDEAARLAAENADPFRFRSWLFGSIGSSSSFEQVRERLLQSVPDFLRRNIRGRSASEHIFHLFLAFLHDAGILESQSPQPTAVERALRESIAFVDKLLAGVGATSTRLALVASNGRCLVALTCDHPLQFLEIQGISDCTACRRKNPNEEDDRRISHEGLRAVIIEADPAVPERAGWRTLRANGALVVGADREVRVFPAA
jgi:glutamine amidotransferase